MKKLLRTSCLLLLPLLMAVKCKDDWLPKPEMPPATQTGKHTFGCKINGELFLPKPMLLSSEGISVSYINNYKNQYFSIRGNHQNSKQVIIRAKDIDSVGVYMLNNQNERYAYYIDDYAVDSCYGSHLHSQTGQLEITRLDTRKRIISGTFNFTITQPGCPDIEVTEGRFDVNY